MRKDAWRDTQRHSTKLNERESLGQPLTTPKLNPTSLLQTSAFIYFNLYLHCRRYSKSRPLRETRLRLSIVTKRKAECWGDCHCLFLPGTKTDSVLLFLLLSS